MYSLYFVTLIQFVLLKQITAKYSPVLIYGKKLPQRPVFPGLTKDEFRGILEKFIHDFTVFVILEENFQTRQLSCQSTPLEECLSDFPKGYEWTFYGSVENAYMALNELYTEKIEAVLDKEGKLAMSNLCNEGFHKKLYTLSLPESEELNKKLSLLEMRTVIIRDIVQKLKECAYKPLFLFTDELVADIQYVDPNSDQTLMVKGISTTITKGKVIIDVATKAHKLFDSTDSEVKNLVLTFIKKPYAYTVVTANYDGEEYRSKKLRWPKAFNVDTPGLIFTQGNKKLRINKAHLERFSGILGDKKEHINYEDDWYTCVYVTPPILMALFVIGIMLSIVFFGLSMILNIKTNDRFDGPKMQALQFSTGDN